MGAARGVGVVGRATAPVGRSGALVGFGVLLAGAAGALAGCAAAPAAVPSASAYATLAAPVARPGPPQVVTAGPRPAASPDPTAVRSRPPLGVVPVGPGTDPGTRAPDAPAFSGCGRAAPDPATTDLRPRTLSAADRALAKDRYGDLPDGELLVESAGDLVLPGGTVGAGNGYEAATAGVTPVPVASGTVTAHVSLLVDDSEQSGRRVAFVELRLAGAAPVRWDEERALGIGTDGGDGGFVATGATRAVTDPDALEFAPDDMIAAFFPTKDVDTWNQCVLRSTRGTVDGVLFDTGWGDGWYPTYLGRDAGGRVVAVLSDGGVVPWEFSGLPGELPAGVALGDGAG